MRIHSPTTIVLSLCLLCYSTNAQWNGPYCLLENLPIVLLHRNSETGEFTLVKRFQADTTELEDEGQFRHLEFQDLVDEATGNLRHSWISGVGARQIFQRNLSPVKDIQLINDLTDPVEEEPILPTIAPSIEKTKDQLFYARECSCFSEYPTSYCPFTVETCQRPESSDINDYAQCLTPGANPTRTKFLFFMMLICYFSIGILLFFTRYGQNVCDYTISCCFPNWTQRRASQVERNEPNRTGLLLRQFYMREHRRLTVQLRRLYHRAARVTEEQSDRERQGMLQTIANMFNVHGVLASGRMLAAQGDAETGSHDQRKPQALALKTQIFRSPPKTEEGGDEDEDRDGCIICFGPLEDGDRVAVLKCQHLFHVDCLKGWLKRKNTCPLCQSTDIATPHPLPAKDESSSETANTSSSPSEHYSNTINPNTDMETSSNQDINT